MMEVFAPWLIGPLAVVLMAVAWIGVQVAWMKVFARAGADPDALAGRPGCHGCGTHRRCLKRSAGACVRKPSRD